MKYIWNIIQKITKQDKKVLGRWSIDYCDKKMNNKIDLSNEDHCGPCGHYIIQKGKINNKHYDSSEGNK